MIGERLGKWVIFKELGRGGMGRVFLAQEEMAGRQAAIKILSAELAQESGFLTRFQREIETLSKLDHPNIVHFYESGYENGMYYYAMEYVEGQSLDDVLQAQKRLPWQEVLDAALQICPALRHAHDHGVIHRDIKPPNLLRTSAGQIKLTDFGIAKVFASRHLTATGGVVGTAEFLSPEQASGKPVTKRSDLYSLGVVLYNLLTGRTPFEGNSFLDLLHKHRYAQFDRPQRVVPEIPYELDELVCQLLEKDPAKRPPDCLVLGRQLEALRRRLERKGHATMGDAANSPTVAENLDDLDDEAMVGPGTLMSRLMRSELDRQNQGGWLSRLLNHGWVLGLLLALCVGVIVWTFWPASAESLYQRGAELMASTRPADWEIAWRDYFQQLNQKYPEHPYQAEIKKFQQQLEAARHTRPGEAQRFFQQAERLLHEGQVTEARKTWRNIVQAFAGLDDEKEWVRRSEEALAALDKNGAARERTERLRPVLEHAARLQANGQPADAERIWSALEELYRGDPEVLLEVAAARKK
jgi:serine/threonine-protein kinase